MHITTYHSGIYAASSPIGDHLPGLADTSMLPSEPIRDVYRQCYLRPVYNGNNCPECSNVYDPTMLICNGETYASEAYHCLREIERGDHNNYLPQHALLVTPAHNDQYLIHHVSFT